MEFFGDYQQVVTGFDGVVAPADPLRRGQLGEGVGLRLAKNRPVRPFAGDDEGAAPPLPSFEDFGIPEALLESIAAMGWIHPTPVQVRCFSSFASGRGRRRLSASVPTKT